MKTRGLVAARNKVAKLKIDRRHIRKAADIVRAGGLVAMPTETVYGLAADATDHKAVARIFDAKGRPQFNPLIVHVADAAMAKRFVEWPALAQKLSEKFWPGPLTLVLKRRAGCAVSLLASAGLDTLAVRMPDHPIAQSLIKAVGRPLAAPSANVSGTVSPTLAAHVRASLGDKVDMILDGGPCAVGLESTIVKIDGEEALLRPGGVAREEIEAVIGAPLKMPSKSARPEAPGMLASHYAPRARVRLNVKAPKPNEAFLAFGPTHVDKSQTALNLSPSRNLREATANLFAHLRALDEMCAQQDLEGIAVAPIPAEGLGEAINDRLARAAARN